MHVGVDASATTSLFVQTSNIGFHVFPALYCKTMLIYSTDTEKYTDDVQRVREDIGKGIGFSIQPCTCLLSTVLANKYINFK